MKFFLLSLFLIATTISCRSQQATINIPDSVQIKNTIIDFYKWYNANWNKLAAYKLYKSKNDKEGPPYIINWKEAASYFGLQIEKPCMPYIYFVENC